MGKGRFEMKHDKAPIIFSVVPVPDDIEAYKKVFYDLIQALESQIPSKIYEAVKESQELISKFGNIFSTSLSLSNVGGLEMALTDSQKESMKLSEVEFLKKEFASLPKPSRESIISYLRDLGERAAVVLECLFYYTRSGDEKEFFHSQNFDALLKSYQEALDICQENEDVEVEGPYNSKDLVQAVNQPSDYIFWKLQMKSSGSVYILRATTSPEILNSEEKIGKKQGLTIAVLDQKGKEVEKEFPLEDLEEKVKKLEIPGE